MGVDLIFVKDYDGDWEVLYVNGEEECQGHRIDDSDLIKVIKKYKVFSGNIEVYEVADAEWIENLGHFPQYFEDIPEGKIK